MDESYPQSTVQSGPNLRATKNLENVFARQGSITYIETCYGLLQILTTAYQTHVDHMAPV